MRAHGERCSTCCIFERITLNSPMGISSWESSIQNSASLLTYIRVSILMKGEKFTYTAIDINDNNDIYSMNKLLVSISLYRTGCTKFNEKTYLWCSFYSLVKPSRMSKITKLNNKIM